MSIHADPRFEYPSYCGFEEENTEVIHNFIFEKKATWKQYRKQFDEALNIIRSFNPDVIVIPFGADTLNNDPDASNLYGCALEVNDYLEMGKMIGELGKKVIITQEGGYDLARVPQVILNLLSSCLDSLGKNC